MNSRRQVTLFVPSDEARLLEPIRKRMDPVQHRLIAAHVTLCRDEDLAHLPDAELESRLAHAGQLPLTLQFGRPEAFGGHGVLLPCVAGEESFDRLRVALLGVEARPHGAHITLAHPRNPRAAGNVASTWASLAFPLSISFSEVSLIEQRDGQPWEVRETHQFPAEG